MMNGTDVEGFFAIGADTTGSAGHKRRRNGEDEGSGMDDPLSKLALVQAVLAQMFDQHQVVLLGMAIPPDRLGAPDGGLPILLIEAQRLWHEAFPAEIRDRFGVQFDFGLRASRQTLTGVEVTHLGRFPASVLLTVIRASAMQMARDNIIDLSDGARRLTDALTNLKMQQAAVPTMEPT